MSGHADQPADADARAAHAAASVRALFGRRLLALPGTWLPVVTPGRRRWVGPWHYWWQAHVVDALVDEGHRGLATGDDGAARYAARLAHLLLRTVRLRNALRFPNHYYDDMAWLALAAHRLAGLDLALDDSPSGVRPLPRAVGRALTPRLQRADTPDLGGGLFWNDHHDFKNAPATGPGALYFARIGDRERARRLVDWMLDRLVDPHTGLVRDGIRLGTGGEPTLVPDVYTYNQGTLIGALVELGDAASLDRAAQLVGAVDTQLVTEVAGRRVLHTHGGHDGGLFTGILVRYLALAARADGLDPHARTQARRLVEDTADAFWDGRGPAPWVPRRNRASARPWVFPADPAFPLPAHPAQALGVGDGGIPVELSTQVQAWTILEAAALLARA